jgi:hypothetical protein
MFPFVFEWAWDMPHIVFMGGFWCAVSIIVLGLIYSIIRAVIDTAPKKENHG